MTSPKDRYGQTPLMNAAAAGRVDEVRRLLAEGVDLDVTAKYGLSALMLAVIRGHREVAELLVRAGADRSVRGRGAPGFFDKTALDLARDRGDEDLVRLLEEAGPATGPASPPAPAFETVEGWAGADSLLPLPPLRPGDTLGLDRQGLHVHLRDHRDRELPPERRSLEAHYGGFVFAQSVPGAAEARRLALDVSYGPDAMPLRIGPREGRAYARGPVPQTDDPDAPLPAVVTWYEGDRHFLLASDSLSVEQLVQIAGSVHR